MVVLVLAGALGLGYYVYQQGIGPASPSSTSSPSQTSGSWWPQSNIAEVQQAQASADAGDANYTWQLDPSLAGDTGPWGAEILDRFLREVFGWEEFRTGDGFASVEGGGLFTELVFLRCAPGRPNPLYPYDPVAGRCAPTIDDFRYETVVLTIEQPGRRGPSGIWVVTEWKELPPAERTSIDKHFITDFLAGQVEQVAPPSDGEATAVLQSFLGARVAGEGAEQYVHQHLEEADASRFAAPPPGEVPLLYATSEGAAYERYEIYRGVGPVWPEGFIEFRIRLFAADGTVVEQSVAVVRQEDGRVGLMYGVSGLTTENGQPVPTPYSFLGGDVTFTAAGRWSNYRDALYLGRQQPVGRFEIVADPREVESRCNAGPAPGDAEALLRNIQSNPDLKTTAPVTVRVGAIDALRIDIVAAPGASLCEQPYQGPIVLTEGGSTPLELGLENRMRLYLLDLRGRSGQILAIVIAAPASEFQQALEAATPIVDSIEFHLP